MHIELKILPEHTLGFVKSEFTTLFPYLKLEFYRDNKENPNKRSKGMDLTIELPIGYFTKGIATEVIIHEAMTVAEVEKIIFDSFKIHVKVHRKSGVSWLETTITMDWSLDYQNWQGEATSRYFLGNTPTQ